MRKYSEVVVAPVPSVVSSRSMPAIAVVAADGDQRSKYPKPKSPRCSADAGAAAVVAVDAGTERILIHMLGSVL